MPNAILTPNVRPDSSIRPSEVIRIGRWSNQDARLILKLMNQLDQLIADIDGRNLGLGLCWLLNGNRLRRFGGGLILGDESSGEEEEGEGVFHAMHKNGVTFCSCRARQAAA